MTLTTNDGKPIGEAHRLLLTIIGHEEKAGEVWNATRTSLGDKWGSGPAQAEGIPGTITLVNSAVKHVWALDPTGARVKELPIILSGGKATFTVGPDYQTVWYEIGR
jgi:hypothetical protein